MLNSNPMKNLKKVYFLLKKAIICKTSEDQIIQNYKESITNDVYESTGIFEEKSSSIYFGKTRNNSDMKKIDKFSKNSIVQSIGDFYFEGFSSSILEPNDNSAINSNFLNIEKNPFQILPNEFKNEVKNSEFNQEAINKESDTNEFGNDKVVDIGIFILIFKVNKVKY